MRVHISLSSLSDSRWYEFLIRFVLGGAVTVLTGIISSLWGASIGGLFLALPAIFCASATLIERHEIRRKREAGGEGTRRGREAAALDAAGAALGSLAMIGFAAAFLALSSSRASVAFAGARAVWLLIAIGAWRLREARLSAGRGDPSQPGVPVGLARVTPGALTCTSWPSRIASEAAATAASNAASLVMYSPSTSPSCRMLHLPLTDVIA